MLEKERREKIIELIEQVLPLLTQYEREIFEMYVLEGRTFEYIGSQLGKNKSTICRKLDNLHKLIAERCGDMDSLLELRNYIVDNPSTLEAKVASISLGWNTERLSKSCVGYRWGITRGRKEYKPIYKCLIDTYTDAICSMCGVRCNNSVNKERLSEKYCEAV